jgi:enoyl-CoA hydratase
VAALPERGYPIQGALKRSGGNEMVTIMEEKNVQLMRDGEIATIIIHRPESLNALNPDVLQGIVLELTTLSRDESVRAVIITGSGPKAFVAGADINSMSQLGPRALADYVELGQRTMRMIETFTAPVIAAVNGFALGGGLELALACDLIICAEGAKLGQPEVNLGIIPGFGGTQRLIQRCGIGAARRLCYTGELVSAEEARMLGLVDKVVSDECLMQEAKNWAAMICSKAPLAVQGAKRVINRAHESLLLSGLRLEVEEFLRLFESADRAEGMEAFLQKRKPVFKGR